MMNSCDMTLKDFYGDGFMSGIYLNKLEISLDLFERMYNVGVFDINNLTALQGHSGIRGHREIDWIRQNICFTELVKDHDYYEIFRNIARHLIKENKDRCSHTWSVLMYMIEYLRPSEFDQELIDDIRKQYEITYNMDNDLWKYNIQKKVYFELLPSKVFAKLKNVNTPDNARLLLNLVDEQLKHNNVNVLKFLIRRSDLIDCN